MFYCIIHGSVKEPVSTCKYCLEGMKVAKEHQDTLELFRPNPAVCSFCGGPTPCLKES